MKKLFLASIVSLILATNAISVSYNSDPKIFISELVNDAVKTLSDNSLPEEKKKETIKRIALENVDIKALGLYTLGGIRKNLSPEDLEKYNGLFRDYLLKSLTSRLSEYSSQKFIVIESEQKSSNITIVKSKVEASDSKPELNVAWRVYTKDPLKPLIRDLIVEGLSLARTQKEEFASILNSNNNDINVLFTKLEEFISK